MQVLQAQYPHFPESTCPHKAQSDTIIATEVSPSARSPYNMLPISPFASSAQITAMITPTTSTTSNGVSQASR